MSLADVQHQPHARRLIQRAIRRGRLPHAYIFHGPDGVGKESFARGFAQLVLCAQSVERTSDGVDAKPIGDGCGACDDCRMVVAETHPDLHIVYRQLNREHPDADVRKRKGLDLGVDVLRHFVIEKVGLTPMRNRAKVFLLREADTMTAQAQNALLKTLEEPPGRTFLILLAVSLNELLPTTLSRCQVIRFDALPTGFIRDKLFSLRPNLSNAQVLWCAAHADGSLGRAVECADDELFFLHERVVKLLDRPDRFRPVAFVELVTGESKTAGERFRKRDPDITETEATRRGLGVVFRLVSDRFAEFLRHNADGSNKNWMPNECIAAIHRIAEAERQLGLNANVQLVVESLAGDLAQNIASSQRVSPVR